VQAAAAVACIAAGLATNSLGMKCLSAGLIIVATVFVTFLIGVSNQGVEQTLVGSGFDISYFDLALPFLLVPLLFACPVTADRAKWVARPGPEPAGGGR
jgi:hypothetical protein